MSTLYLKGIEVALKAAMNVAAAPVGTPKLEYMATSYTPDASTHQYWSDISASKASGAPTETLTGVAVNIDGSNLRVAVDADNVSENSITTTTNKFVIKIDTGNDATSPLIYCGDISEGTLSPISGTLALTFNASGLFAINDN